MQLLWKFPARTALGEHVCVIFASEHYVGSANQLCAPGLIENREIIFSLNLPIFEQSWHEQKPKAGLTLFASKLRVVWQRKTKTGAHTRPKVNCKGVSGLPYDHNVYASCASLWTCGSRQHQTCWFSTQKTARVVKILDKLSNYNRIWTHAVCMELMRMITSSFFRSDVSCLSIWISAHVLS